MGHVTLQTIADAVGVSRTTVSNAYNRPNELSPTLRSRILATAEQLGYRGPNAAARMLRTGRMGTIGLVFTDDLRYVFADPDTTGFMRGVAETAAASAIGLSLLPVPRGVDPIRTALATAPVDGYLVFSVAAEHPAVGLVVDAGVPVVVVDEPDLPNLASFVGIDDRTGARLVAEHVLQHGHRHVACVVHRTTTGSSPGEVAIDAVSQATVRVSRLRLEAFRDCLAAHDLAPTVIFDAAGNDRDAGFAAAMTLLRSHPQTTAILCTTDQIALGAMRAAASLGLRVPDDVSVTGFDDVPAASTSAPTLTTVRQPIVDKGRAATELLLDQIDSGIRRRVELPIELVVRESTARAPSVR